MTMEYFEINGFPDYRLVRLSERDFYVESKKSGEWKVIGSKDDSGHVSLCLCSGENNRITYLHTIIAEMFVSNPENKPIVHHIDGDATNNDPATNLMWVTQSEHMQIHMNNMPDERHKAMSECKKGENNPMYGKHHSEETKRKISNSMNGRQKVDGSGKAPKAVEQWSKDGAMLIAVYESMSEAARQTNICYQSILAASNGKLKKAGGYKWKQQQ